VSIKARGLSGLFPNSDSRMDNPQCVGIHHFSSGVSEDDLDDGHCQSIAFANLGRSNRPSLQSKLGLCCRRRDRGSHTRWARGSRRRTGRARLALVDLEYFEKKYVEQSRRKYGAMGVSAVRPVATMSKLTRWSRCSPVDMFAGCDTKIMPLYLTWARHKLQ
jgi:hypothetical protein